MRLLCLICLIWLHGPLWGEQTSTGSIEALIVADLGDGDIGCARDVKNIKKSLDVIGEKIGFTVSSSVLKNQNFSARPVIQSLKRLSFSKNNIIVFYYTGHGFNDENHSSFWPTLYTRKKRLAGSAIVRFLRHRASRCSIVIFDCCNSKTNMKRIILSIRSAVKSALSPHDDLCGFASLLLRSKGLIVMAAAQVGESALGDPINGGVFTSQLLGTIKNKGGDGALTWNSIFQEASFNTTSLAAPRWQHPVLRVEPGL